MVMMGLDLHSTVEETGERTIAAHCDVWSDEANPGCCGYGLALAGTRAVIPTGQVQECNGGGALLKQIKTNANPCHFPDIGGQDKIVFFFQPAVSNAVAVCCISEVVF